MSSNVEFDEDMVRTAIEEQDNNGGSRRGSRTISKVSHHEARRALLSATMKRKELAISKSNSTSSADVAERLGEKANRAVALKNANASKKKNKFDQEILQTCCSESSRSHDSSKVRRSDHPAIAGRKSIGAPSKLSGADLLTSFRQFNATRSESIKGMSSLRHALSYVAQP
jgi:hypothetical protein